MKIQLELKNENTVIPSYKFDGDAGMDVCALDDVIIPPGKTIIIKTGIKTAIPYGYEIQVRPRSGCSAKTKIRVANTPGTIDCNYRDEIGIILENTSKDYVWTSENTIEKIKPNCVFDLNVKESPDGFYKISAGDRIAQLVFCKVEKADWELVKDVSLIGDNRGGGFGHTGIN